MNLNYRDRINVNRQLAGYIETNHPSAQTLTWWPLTHVISDPTLGYVHSPFNVASINIDRPGFHWVDRETSVISDAAFHDEDLAEIDLVASGDMIASMIVHQQLLTQLPLTELKRFKVGFMGAVVSAQENKQAELPKHPF